MASCARSSATPPPGTMPSSTAARVADRASSMRCFFSLSSTSVAAPTWMTATPPASLARRSWSFSRSQSESVFSISALIWLIRPLSASLSPAPSMTVVSSLVTTTFLELQSDFFADDLGAGERRDVLEHRLSAIAEPGGLDGDHVERATDLVDDEGRECLSLDVFCDHQQRT